MSRVLTFLKRAPMVVLRFIFSKKFLKWSSCLFAVLALAVWLTHVFYNRYAWKHWDEVNERLTAEYRLDEENRFYSVPPEKDFFEDPFVKAYFEREDNRRLDRVDNMLFVEKGVRLSRNQRKDIRQWVVGREFLTNK